MSATPEDILNRAADLIDRDGWVQGRFGRRSCGWCASGAILEAGSWLNEAFVARNALAGTVGMGVIYWNDNYDRTKAEVVTALRETAARLRYEAST